MFTVCPKCALTLVVTAADLRIAQGYVRCGRCLNVFNALARLSEERPATSPQPPPETTAAESADQAPAPEEEPAPSSTIEPSSTIDDTGEIEVELDASVFAESVRAPGVPETAPRPEPRAAEPGPVTPSPEPPATVAAAAPATTPAPDSRAPAAPPDTQVARSAAVLSDERAGSSSLADARDRQETNTPQQGPEDTFDLATLRPRTGIAWNIGAGVLALALALQVVNHYRDALATNPALRGPLTAMYSALGVKLAPQWDIHAYDVRQLGASVAGATAGEIVVRASVKNSASRAQPLPLLRVTLQDRFGNRIAARDVPPGDYLPSSVAPSSLLAAGSRVDATMVFVDPGPQAVGFEIDACLRERSGAVACAHGP